MNMDQKNKWQATSANFIRTKIQITEFITLSVVIVFNDSSWKSHKIRKIISQMFCQPNTDFNKYVDDFSNFWPF